MYELANAYEMTGQMTKALTIDMVYVIAGHRRHYYSLLT